MCEPCFKELELKGKKVDVYFNLRNHLWSVRDRQTRRIIAHVDTITLEGVEFIVSEPGRQRVLDQKRRNVHAYARGTVGLYSFECHDRVSYNPYKGPWFYRVEDDSPIYRAACASFHQGKVYVDDRS